MLKNSYRLLATASAVALLSSAGSALAQDNISGSAGYSYNSHFISYGADVWGAGDEWLFDDETTNFFWFDIALDFDPVTVNFGAWSEVNDNTTSGIGGNIQEVDIYGGISYTAGIATVGATYQQWFYAGDNEEVVDFSLAIDDSELIPAFPLSPKVVWHIRANGNDNAGQEDGSAVVVSIAPSIDLGMAGMGLTFPAGIAFFLEDDFQGGWDGGYAYSYIGGSLGVPLSFVPEEYGSWSVNFDVTGYFTDEKAIPNNPEENFITSSVGLVLAY